MMEKTPYRLSSDLHVYTVACSPLPLVHACESLKSLFFCFLNQAMDTSKKYPVSDRLVLSSQSMFPKSLLGQ